MFRVARFLLRSSRIREPNGPRETLLPSVSRGCCGGCPAGLGSNGVGAGTGPWCGFSAFAIRGANFQSRMRSLSWTERQGNAKSHRRFEPPRTFPDFTECSQTTPEDSTAWKAIITHGGPNRGFSQIMPSFRQALSSEQIDKVIGYMRGFCHEPKWPRGELNLPRALVTEKAYPEDEVVLSTAVMRGALRGDAEIDCVADIRARTGIHRVWCAGPRRGQKATQAGISHVRSMPCLPQRIKDRERRGGLHRLRLAGQPYGEFIARPLLASQRAARNSRSP